MKIAIIDPSLFTIPYDRELCDALAKRGDTVHLYGCPLREGETLELDETHFHPFFYQFIHFIDGFPKVIRLFLKGLNHIYSMFCLIFELVRLKPDVIHFQWCPLPMVDRWFLPRFKKIAPLVLTVHDTTPFNDDPASALQRIGTVGILELFDRLIVHTQRGISRLTSVSLRKDKIAVIPHGILSHGSPIPTKESDNAEVETSNNGKILFLQFGKIKPYKGIDLLIQAVAKMSEDVRNRCHFLIIGKPYMDIDPLKQMCEQFGVSEQFTFDLRFIDDQEIMRLFERAEVLLFPYREIEASGVLMASLAAGRPIVATRIGAFDEVLENNEHGYLVPSEDFAALADALAEMALKKDERIRMGKNVRKLFERIPNWSEIAGMTGKLYHNVISERLEQRNLENKSLQHQAGVAQK